ncbi:MAG TPA: hypothetical protein VIG55_07760 [Methylosinus sp.]|jgi:hypothetical protein
MIRQKLQNLPAPIRLAGADADRLTAIVGMIDYLIVECHESEPLAEYFLKMARLSLLEAEQRHADAVGRN